MANLDFIDVCVDCFMPIEGLKRCPDCGGRTERINSLALEIIRTLKDKQYKPLSCCVLGYGNNKCVSVVFDGHSPGRGVHLEMNTQIDKDGRIACSTRLGAGVLHSVVYEWAVEAPELSRALPFNRSFCEMCAPQSEVLWLGGVCNCPCNAQSGRDTGDREFGHGFPERCPYLAEQVMTKHRVAESLGVEM